MGGQGLFTTVEQQENEKELELQETFEDKGDEDVLNV
jgi:hypothetical protein